MNDERRGTRRTVVVHGRLASRERRLQAAREHDHDLQVLTFEQLAARLAGGLARPVDDDTLRSLVQASLPDTDLGELEPIKDLPGLTGAATDTLKKAWRAGLNLQAMADERPRLAAMAALERAVLGRMSVELKPPHVLAAAALNRVHHSSKLFGAVVIVGVTELSPCWRALLEVLARHTLVRWLAGPRTIPAWLGDMSVEVVRTGASTPRIEPVSGATAYHEAIEALRWARALIVDGRAKPEEIAITAVSPAEYDHHLLALRADANLDLAFVHGLPVTACREGQAAAALADALLRGPSQTRVRRLAALLGAYAGPFQALPAGWTRVLPADAPLSSPRAWGRLLDRLSPDAWPEGGDHTSDLRVIVDVLNRGPDHAADVGETLLSGRPLTIWRRALLAGPAASVDLTLDALKQDDSIDPCAGVAWLPASALAASPRPFVRLLGLNSGRWPRGQSEDRLLSDHILPKTLLDPLPLSAADRRDFETILRTTRSEVVLSRARRDSDGRLLGRSPLLQAWPDEVYLRRNRVPEHAFSETDRLTARPEEFRTGPQAVVAATCWRTWRRPEVGAHDGLLRPDHPMIEAILSRTQSASSLRLLLRNPIGFVWRYGLRWRAPESGEEPLVLDALAFGDLVHQCLDRAVCALERDRGFASASRDQVIVAVGEALEDVTGRWALERPVPPGVIWRRTLDEVRSMAITALTDLEPPMPNARSFSEVAFGGAEPRTDADPPWDIAKPVFVPGAGFRVSGYIDRLDLAGDGGAARVRDYKTGRCPKTPVVLDGGAELQRCLYGFAVRDQLGPDVQISASLLYLRDGVARELGDAEGVLTDAAGYLQTARLSLMGGAALPGPDTGGDYDDLAFALPANAAATYCKRKAATVAERLGEATRVWEAA